MTGYNKPMPLVSFVARPLLSSLFVSSGIQHVRHPELVAGMALPVTSKLVERFPSLPKDPASLVRVHAAVQVAAGLALSTGRSRRLAAVVLAGSLVPTTIAGHAFWKEADPITRVAQRTQFQKNMAMFAGLLLEATDRGGKPSLSWRAKRKASSATAAIAASRLPLG
jgi:uncharacterized membrane protein YphA (DoxX/SURF4 family)